VEKSQLPEKPPWDFLVHPGPGDRIYKEMPWTTLDEGIFRYDYGIWDNVFYLFITPGPYYPYYPFTNRIFVNSRNIIQSQGL
jgi:hypothetical protein